MGTPKLLLILAMVGGTQRLIRVINMSSDPREFCISTKEFILDESGKLKGLNTGAYLRRLADLGLTMMTPVRVEWTKDSRGRWKMEEVPGSEKFFTAQLVFLALGFLGPQSEVISALGVKQDGRSNIQTPAKVCVAACASETGVDVVP